MSKFSSPFMAKSPLKHVNTAGSTDHLHNGKPHPPTGSGSIEFAAKPKITGGAVGVPSGHGQAFKVMAGAAAAATAISSPAVWHMPKILDKKDEAIDAVSTFVTDKVIPKVQKVKAKVGGKIRRAVGMDKHIYPGSSGA